MSEKKYNWAYFWELFFVYPRFTLVLFLLLGVENFLANYLYSSKTVLDASLMTIGGLIMVIPVKAFFTGVFQFLFKKEDLDPTRFVFFFLWRGLLFALLAGPFVFPVMAKYGEQFPPYVEKQHP